MATYHESARTSILKLNSSNYHQWKFGIEMVLLKENLLEIVIGETPGELTESWKKLDNSARASIALSVEVSLHPLIMETKSAKEMWLKLKFHFERVSYSSRIFLKRKLFSTRLEGNRMEEYIGKITLLTHKLRAGGAKIEEEDVISIILCGLDESYDGLIMAIEGREETPMSLEAVKMKLIDESIRREEKTEINYDNQQALITNQRREPRSQYSSERTCYGCRQQGHIKYYCPNKRGNTISRRKKESNFVSFNNENKPHDKDKEETINSSLNEKSNYCNSETTCNLKEPNEKYYAYVSVGEIASNPKAENLEWVLDSGATAHMTYNKNLFGKYHEFETKREVVFANGSSSPAEGIGSVTININKESEEDNLVIDEVLYVPNMKVNLLSVPILSTNGYEITFENENCSITLNGKMLLQGSIKDGVFVAAATNKIDKNYSACIHTWHERLGHRSLDKIKQMSKSPDIKNLIISKCDHSDFCRTCQLCTMKQRTFKRVNNCQSSKPFQLIHMDLCGPIRPISKGGGSYFLAMTDDYSRYCQVEILSNKFQAFQNIKRFIEFNQCRFGYYPQAIRSDNGGEFLNQEMSSYLNNRGIHHQLSIPYQPQENGISERINSTLVNMAKCMLTERNMHKNLWGEAIRSACYLYNRIIHSFTKKVPLCLWENKVVDLSHLKVLGSQCYAYKPKTQRSKMDNSSIELIITGYSQNHKGYRLLNEHDDKITISNNIRCDETNNTNRIDLSDKLSNPELDNYVPMDDNMEHDEQQIDETITVRRSNRSNFGKKPSRFLN